jgi:hypothetical protein
METVAKAFCRTALALVQSFDSTKDYIMPDSIVLAALRAAVILPVMLLLAALAWFSFKKAGIVKSGVPFNPGDMRTWPLRFVLVVAATFTLSFSVILALIGESTYTAGIASGISAVLALGVTPRLAARFLK